MVKQALYFYEKVCYNKVNNLKKGSAYILEIGVKREQTTLEKLGLKPFKGIPGVYSADPKAMKVLRGVADIAEARSQEEYNMALKSLTPAEQLRVRTEEERLWNINFDNGDFSLESQAVSSIAAINTVLDKDKKVHTAAELFGEVMDNLK